MICDALAGAIAQEAEQLAVASGATGRPVRVDPAALLARGRPLAMPGRTSANGSAHLLRAGDGWLALNLARPEDVEALPAWVGAELPGDPLVALATLLPSRPLGPLLDQAALLGLPVAAVGEARPLPPPALPAAPESPATQVVDLSALWAGPLCAGLLARAGLPVLRLESTRRPDPTPRSDPLLDAALNGAKRREALDLAPETLLERIESARILVTSGRPHALARLGLVPETLLAACPGLLWVAITAHGWHGEAGRRVGFGDDCAAAGGLVRWQHGAPNFIGDALADPLSGLRAARLALEALAQGRSGLLDVPLAGTAAAFAQAAGMA